jgi:hypothetical protein
MNRFEFTVCSAAAVVATVSSIQVAARPPATPAFRFRSGFWQNLHHTLYYQAQVLETVYGAGAAQLAPIDRAADRDFVTATNGNQDVWFRAVRIYHDHYASMSFVFDERLMSDDSAISGDEAQPLPASLPAPMRQALHIAAPIYRDALWKTHDASNRAFINRLSALVTRYHAELSARLAHIYTAQWLAQPYVVDVVQYAQWNGSYSNNAGNFVHIVMSAQDPSGRGMGALDMLFHEASHSVTDPTHGTIGGPIAVAAAKLNRPAPDQFWHAVIMYAPGKLVEELAKSSNEKYTMVWMQPGLFGGSWRRYYAALQTHFYPYMQRSGTLDSALTACVREIVSL